MTKREIKVKNGDKEKSVADPEINDERVEPSNDQSADSISDSDANKAAQAAAKYAEQAEPDEPKPEPTAEEKVEDLTDKLLRMAAEFDNYRKRNSKEFERGRTTGAVRIIERILPVLDSFDVALSNDPSEKELPVFEGLKKIREQMIEGLISAGLQIIEPAKGDPMDPNFHEAMTVTETDQTPCDHVFALFQRGYSFQGQLVRPAKVQVAKTPSTQEEN